jgi:hypothetical protein
LIINYFRFFVGHHEIINDAASAYKGIIPEDRWHEPYMSETELQGQIDDGVTFWCYVESDIIIGVMGFQAKGDVTLIRHAYVRTTARNRATGTAKEILVDPTTPD